MIILKIIGVIIAICIIVLIILFSYSACILSSKLKNNDLDEYLYGDKENKDED